MTFEIRLDSKVKHFNSRIYGILDAVGTLGGIFEILLWSLMLIYGSIRKNMYLFSVINRLIRITQNEDFKPINDDSKSINIPVPTNELGNIQKFNRTMKNRNQIYTNLKERQQNPEVSPILFKRKKHAKTKIQLDTETDLREQPYPYSVLLESFLPFSK